MRYCYWCNQCPYNKQCSRVNYPASEYPDGYMTPLPEYYDRDKFNLDAEKSAGVKAQPMKSLNNESEEMMKKLDQRQNDITRTVEILNQRALREFDEITRVGMDRKLLDYINRTLIQYIDKNYDRYQGTISRKTELSIFDIKRDLIWVFDILRIYNISPSTESRLLDKASRIALQNLREE